MNLIDKSLCKCDFSKSINRYSRRCIQYSRIEFNGISRSKESNL